ncbi:hypothetical protein V6N13_060312 [Hibiscus sabdariffa]
MEAAASVAAGWSGSLPMSSPSRKEWRAVSELHVVQNPGDKVFVEMERLHLHAIHQLQFELAAARERNSSTADESHAPQAKSEDSSKFGKSNENQVDSNGSVSTNNAWLISNGASDSVQSFTSDGNVPTEKRVHSYL